MSQASLLPAASSGKSRQRLITDHVRQEQDWYVEPIWCTELLLKAVQFVGPIWDPCCGGGNIIKAIGKFGSWDNGCRATDLIHRGFGEGGKDFLQSRDWAHNIIFNPPYNKAEEFIIHALSLAESKVAALVNIKFLSSQGRRERLFNKYPPAIVLILSRRPSMPPGDAGIEAKGGTADYCWIVWENDESRLPDRHMPQIGWIA